MRNTTCMADYSEVQHGFEIQFARMSSIYEKLGAKPMKGKLK